MIRKIILILLLDFCVIPLTLKCEKVCDLNGVMKPEQLVIDNNNIYLVEKFRIHIYSLKDYKLISSFGKKGEGPGEFPMKFPLQIQKNTLFFDALYKIMFFTRKGIFINEKRKPFSCHRIMPVKDHFIGFDLHFEAEEIEKILIYYIYGSNFEKIKKIGNNIHAGKLVKRVRKKEKYDSYIPRINKRYLVYKDNIFIGDPAKGIYFEVFNYKGELIKKISRDFKPRKVTLEFKNKFLEIQKNKKNWEEIKASKNFIFEKYFPCYEWFYINNDRIYLFTYKIEEDQRECLILNMDGDIKQKTTIKNVYWRLLSISGKYFYYVIENEENETWELHQDPISNSIHN